MGFLLNFFITKLSTKDFTPIAGNVKVLCVCGGLVALTFVIAIKLNRITALDFSTSTAITQNTCYAQCFFNGIINLKQ